MKLFIIKISTGVVVEEIEVKGQQDVDAVKRSLSRKFQADTKRGNRPSLVAHRGEV